MSAVYESIVMFGVYFFFVYAFSALLQYRGEDGWMHVALVCWVFIVGGVYFVWFWSDGRRTLPMRTIGLRLVHGDGHPVTRYRAALRYASCYTMVVVPLAATYYTKGIGWLLLLPLPFLFGLFDREHRTLYDRVAGTRLVIDTRPVA